MKSKVPDHIVHYNRAEPFRSITDVPLDQLSIVMDRLDESNSWGLNRFKDQHYFRQRFEVEKGMRTEFIAMGGKPVLLHPIYFFLGRHQRFEEHPLNIGYVIDLVHLHRNSVSFSYGDTMLTFSEENRKLAGDRYQNPLCSKLFMLDELHELFENELFPTESALAVEAHLWVQPEEKIVRRTIR